ncbi:MAG: galactokinase [Actinomycetaceae bacterium]|nr:galactokinase [Actinomycetaceae bacterium]MDY6082867.1 galactokinase [Actinomycetaceae bacterium]
MDVQPQWAQAATDEENRSRAARLFEQTYAHRPEGVWAAPGRVNLIGEHVDYAGGLCLPFALAQSAFAAVARNSEGVYRFISASMPGGVREVPADSVGSSKISTWIGYMAGSLWAAREAGLLRDSSDETSDERSAADGAGADHGAGVDHGAEHGRPQGFDVAILSDVPVGAGLSSSAAIECAVAIAAVELMQHRPANEDERIALVDATMRAENEVVGAATGGLDQKIAMLGRRGHALAIDFGDGSYRQVPFRIEEAGLSILVCNTNAPHALADGQYASRRGVIDGVAAYAGSASLRYVSDPYTVAQAWAQSTVPQGSSAAEWETTVQHRVRHVLTEIDRTRHAIALMESGDFVGFGQAMSASHRSLRDDYEVSTDELNTVVETALSYGALGARMTGGGFGGSAIALVRTESVEGCAAAIAQAFSEKGFNRPEFIQAQPSEGARRVG